MKERYFTRVHSLPTNIRIGWKGFHRTNSLDYYNNSKLLAKKLYYIGTWMKETRPQDPKNGRTGNWFQYLKKLFFFVNDVSAKIS